jgi:hypothetical protein
LLFVIPLCTLKPQKGINYCGLGPALINFALPGNAFRNSWFLAVLLILGIVIGSANAQTQPALFQVVPPITFSADAFNVFAGDINGDGTPDLAYFTLTSSAATLDVLLKVGRDEKGNCYDCLGLT